MGVREFTSFHGGSSYPDDLLHLPKHGKRKKYHSIHKIHGPRFISDQGHRCCFMDFSKFGGVQYENNGSLRFDCKHGVSILGVSLRDILYRDLHIHFRCHF
jgi:hypothetical protein